MSRKTILTVAVLLIGLAAVSVGAQAKTDNQGKVKDDKKNSTTTVVSNATTTTQASTTDDEGNYDNNSNDENEGNKFAVVKIADGLQIQGNKIIVVSNSTDITSSSTSTSTATTTILTEFKMKTALPAFFNRLERNLRQEGATSTEISSLEVTVQDGKPVYNLVINEGVKLFGFIPLKIQTQAEVSSETDQVVSITRPWYAIFTTKPNIKQAIEQE